MNDKELNNDIINDAAKFQAIVNGTLELIFSTIQMFVAQGSHGLALRYLDALTIDMIGKLLTYPRIDKQKEVDYLCKWIKHKYNINLEIKIKNED